MSIIINALTKADDRNKNHKKHGLRFFFKHSHSASRHRLGFFIGMILGGASMFAAGALLLFIINNQSAKQTIPRPIIQRIITVPASQLPQSQAVVNDEQEAVPSRIAELDEPISNVSLGPDIEEELAIEKLMAQRMAQLKAIDEQKPPKGYENGIPALTIEPQAGLPDMIISGVVWDISNRYVFIDGSPYREQDMVKEVLIERITLSSIIVEYKDRTYEIVLQ